MSRKKVLVLGGTVFLGRAVVKALEQRPDLEIYLFNRGKTNPELFPGHTQLRGDREKGDFKAILQHDWDAVIDCCGYYPDTLADLVDSLKGKVGRYIFVSTLSVYPIDESRTAPHNEHDAVLDCTTVQRTDTGMETYGHRKAACEAELLARDWLDAIVLRPSLIYGPYDPFDRTYYWIYQVQQGMDIMLPDDGKPETDMTYVNDLAKLCLEAIDIPEHRRLYNAVTHPGLSLRKLLDSTAKVLGVDYDYHSVSGQELLNRGLRPWADIPMWLPGDFFRFENQRLREDFRTAFTELDESIKETISYYRLKEWYKPRVEINS